MTDKPTGIITSNEKIICSVNINSIKIKTERNVRAILQNLKYDFNRGSIYAIIGKNGCGKTTFLKALSKLLDEQIFNLEGTIFFGNDNILTCEEEKLHYLRRHLVRYVFQDPQNLFDPIKKIGYYFSDYTSSRSDKLAELFDFFLLPKPDKLLTYHPHELSIGMAQRIALILAFISGHKLLLLDEPNSSLDMPVSNLLSKKLVEITEGGGTVIFTTQDINFAMKTANKIIQINETGFSSFNESSVNNGIYKTKLVDY
jgi:ABC-type dipeptide/oligopeptide/nickel transport system ATPase component